jgi:hypothetical protein
MKRPLGKTQCIWECIIEMSLRGMERSAGNWVEVTEDRFQFRALTNMVTKLHVL